MVKTTNGYAPEKGYLLNKIKTIKDFYHDAVPEFVIHEYDQLIDSANIRPEDWITIALDIVKHYKAYDGFVILHGTDTLAYTASALSFMLKNLQKPVICTGSQIPISELRSDATDNILHSLILAADKRIAEVCVYFNKQLMRGNRAVKINSAGMNAFASPNYPLLGEVGIDIVLDESKLLQAENQSITTLEFKSLGIPKIAILTIFPGMDESILEKVLQPPLQGLILKTYGAGNIANTPNILRILSKASQSGVIIINCSQCLQGGVKMGAYEASIGLVRAGVLSGFDMTDEAALTKLFYLLSIPGLSHEDIKEALQKNLRGEMTI
ncbi:asparaginase [Facilibium subflavum]|uniref:asparaginase n=1 Tax=Facilibium subflavum TaxID=2219058 RepID=UPI000E647140